MACTNFWTSPFQVGSHHMARAFVEAGWDVVYISDPISPFHPLGGQCQELKARFEIFRQRGIKDMGGHLWTMVPGAIFTPHRFSFLKTKFILKNWKHFTYPNIVKFLKKEGNDSFDLLYLDSLVQHFWLDSIKYKKSVLRLADNNKGFTKTTPALEWAEKQISKKVDVVVYAAQSLKRRVRELNPKLSHYLPNGINIENFLHKVVKIPEEIKDVPKPIAIYVGALDYWFDFELLNYAAENLPHVSFVLIGPEKLAKARLKPLPNIYLLGSKPYSSISTYLHHGDIGIIPFNTRDYPNLVNFINPLKLYEYLACNLNVVAMDWEELKLLNTPATLCQSFDQFIKAISNFLNQEKNQSISFSEENLKSMDWKNRVNNLIDFLAI